MLNFTTIAIAGILSLSSPVKTGTHNTYANSLHAFPGTAKIDLMWETEQENVATFTIERSQDGETWTELLSVASASTTTHERFLESDFYPIQGTSFYRLRKTYSNGEVAYSNTAVVRNYYNTAQIMGICQDLNITKFDHSGYGNEEAVVALKDTKGNEYFSKVYLLNVNSGIIAVDLEDRLAPGRYVITACTIESLTNLNLVVR